MLGAALACTCNTPSTETTGSTGSTPPVTTWTQVWSDEFEGAAGTPIDATKWRHDLADGCTQGICGWGNNEKEYYTDATENVALNGEGQLMIVARIAPPRGFNCHYGPCRYTSAKVTTRGKMSAAPGRVEARIKIPHGQGLWSAFWMLGSGWPSTPWPDCGELDIMENRGSQATITSSAIHGPGYSGATPFNNAFNPGNTSADGFRVYAIEWNERQVRFFVDNVAHYSVSRSEVEQRGRSVFDQSYFVILNLAVGGTFDGDPQSDAIFPATMLVDYVRVYSPAVSP